MEKREKKNVSGSPSIYNKTTLCENYLASKTTQALELSLINATRRIIYAGEPLH